jgi:hypothetical protein
VENGALVRNEPMLNFPQCFQRSSTTEMSKGISIGERVKQKNNAKAVIVLRISTHMSCNIPSNWGHCTIMLKCWHLECKQHPLFFLFCKLKMS